MSRNENYQKESKGSFSIDMSSIVCDIRKQWWGIAMGGIVFVLLFLSYCATLYTPTYESTILLATYSNNSDVLTNSSKASSVLSTLETMLNEEVLLRIVIQETEIPEYEFTISANGIDNTNLISITVEAENASDSLIVLKSTLSNFEELLDDVMSDVRLVEIQEATLIEKESQTVMLYVYSLLAFVVGAVICIIIVVILSMFRNTVKNYGELKKKVKGNTLGYIPHIPEKYRNTKGILLSWQKEKYRMLSNQVLRKLVQHHDQVLLVTSALPNEGKTTVSIQLAKNIGRQGKRVLLIDGDMRNPSVGKELELGEQHSRDLQNALAEQKYDIDALYKMPDSETYCLMGVDDSKNLGYTFSDGSFEDLLASMKEQFDYIVIDSPPTAVVAYNEIMKQMCDKVLLVVGQDMAPAPMVNQVAEDLHEEEKLLGCVLRHTRSEKRKRTYGYYGYYSDNNAEK